MFRNARLALLSVMPLLVLGCADRDDNYATHHADRDTSDYRARTDHAYVSDYERNRTRRETGGYPDGNAPTAPGGTVISAPTARGM